ncbi:MAG: hypothetical protein DCO96_01495 [Fluviicola sp. XM-24bin1]|nr:MAG: hypothetical protein DCO96_01495 [Fluviicola sp. XM-24bin1]
MSFTWLASDCISWYLGQHRINTFLLFHIYKMVSTSLYAVFFAITLKDFVNRWFIYLGFIGYVILHLLVLTYTDGWYRPVAIVPIISSALPLTLCIILFYRMLLEASIEKLTDSPLYWINSATLIHLGVALIAKISQEFIYLDKAGENLWMIVIFSSIIHNLIFAVGIWKIRAK